MQSVYTNEAPNFLGSGPEREIVKPLQKEESNSPAGGFLEMQHMDDQPRVKADCDSCSVCRACKACWWHVASHFKISWVYSFSLLALPFSNVWISARSLENSTFGLQRRGRPCWWCAKGPSRRSCDRQISQSGHCHVHLIQWKWLVNHAPVEAIKDQGVGNRLLFWIMQGDR